jgi:hypothetical protein
MGLLRLPRMPELKRATAANAMAAFVPSAVDPDGVRFRDKARQKQRQQVRPGRCVCARRVAREQACSADVCLCARVRVVCL